MIVVEDISLFPNIEYPVVTSGTFDGVHLGHQKILLRLNQSARQHNGQSVVLTYWPHPRLVLHQDHDKLKLLSTKQERIELLRSAGVDYLIMVPFTEAFSKWSSERFIKELLLDKIGTKKLVIGYDHKFGKNREGSFEYLTQHAATFGFEVEEIPRQEVDEVGISSTKIRKALQKGDVKRAHDYLGRFYSITGTVVHGKKIGRTLGYPTANIEVPESYKLIPGTGIYAVQATVNGTVYGGMLSIGTNPTVGGTKQTVEVYLFNFSADIYGASLTIWFIDWLREERTFASLEELTFQLKADEEAAFKALLNINKN